MDPQTNYGSQNFHHHQPQQQQLMDEDCCFPLFSVSNPQQHNQSHRHFLYQAHLQHSQQQHPVPVTHQLFQPQQFQVLHQQHESGRLHQQGLRLDHEAAHLPHPLFPVNFKLGLNENSEKGGLDHQEGGSFLHENEQHAPESRAQFLVLPHCWQTQEDSPIKEPFWKPLGKCETRLHSDGGEEEVEGNKFNKALYQEDDCTGERCKNLDRKCRLFGELEAIYSLSKISENNQPAFESALTGENSSRNPGVPGPLSDVQGWNVETNQGEKNTAAGTDHYGSEASIGEEASLRKIQKKKKKKRKMKEQLSSIAGFFESLVKQVMDHQDILHKKFLEVIERIDNERTRKEEAWRCQEVAKFNREAISRAHGLALSSSREALIVTYLEKITGQNLNFPKRSLQPDSTIEPIKDPTAAAKFDTSNRWPAAEVEALIQVRICLEPKFQEPGLKGPLWEEVSSLMASIGYQRSAKRCKEKWENINKYFKKSKENGKKRSQQSKACSYFGQLGQLSVGTSIVCPPSPRSLINVDVDLERQGDSEFSDAFISGRALGAAQIDSCCRFRVSEVSPPKLGLENVGHENTGKDKEKDENADMNGEQGVDDNPGE